MNRPGLTRPHSCASPRQITSWCLSAVVALTDGAVPLSAQPTPPRSIAIEHVTTIDVETGRRRRDQTVIVRGERIIAVGAGDSVGIPRHAQRVDARGQFLIPGLWEMHAHTYRSLDLVPALYLGNGITGVRDMAARFGVQPVLALRDSIRTGLVLGPRMVVGGAVGNVMSGPVGTKPVAVTPHNARAVVDSFARLGVDFIKVVQLTAPTFFATVAAAHEQKHPVAGHLPWAVDIRAASDSGIRSHEHLWGILTACSTREDSLRRAIADSMLRPGAPPDARAEGHFVAALTAHFDAAKCDALFHRLARNDTYEEPTLLVSRQFGWPAEFASSSDSRLRYVHSEELARWRSARAQPLFTTDALEQRALYAAYTRLVAQMAHEGVRILAGSDAGFPFIFHGASLHDELAALVGAGLSPLEALRAATLNPAGYLGATDSLGTIVVGKLADLVLLDADPLVDIRNTKRVRAVFANGRFLDRQALDSLLEVAAARAAAPTPPRVDAGGLPPGQRPTAAECTGQQSAAITYIDVPGNPFQAIPTPDGCWIFVSMTRTARPGAVGIALLRRGPDTVSVVRMVPLDQSPRGMVLTHDGRLLIVAADSAVVFLDAQRLVSGQADPVLGSLKEGRRLYRIHANVTRDDRFLFVSDEGAESITVVDLQRARATGYDAVSVIGRIPVGIAPIALAFSPDERYLYSTSERAPERLRWPIKCGPEGSNPATRAPPGPEGAIFIVDVARAVSRPESSVIGVVRAGCSPVRLALSPDGARSYVTARNSDALLAFDTHKLLEDSAHALVATVPVGRAPVGVAVIDDGRRVVVANSNRFSGGTVTPESLLVIDVRQLAREAGAIVGSIPAQAFPRELAMTSDGRTLLVTNFASRTVELVSLDRLALRSDSVQARRSAAAKSSLHRIGVLTAGANADVTLARGSSRFEMLHAALEELGYGEGDNIAFTIRVARGRTPDARPDGDALEGAARDLVTEGAELIVAGGSTEALAARHVSQTIPIVFWSVEPVAEGLVESLEHPGGNATGVVPGAETFAESLRMLDAVAAGAGPIGLLYNPTYLPGVGVLRRYRRAADSLGLRLVVTEAQDSAAIGAAFDSLAVAGARAVLVGNHGLFLLQARTIVALAARHQLPLLSPYPEARDAGALISAVPDFVFWSRRAAGYVDRILRGASPAGVPVEQSVPWVYTVNLRTAAALGVSIPEWVLRKASRVVR